MPTNSPNTLPTLVCQPLVANQLRVKIGHLVGCVMKKGLFNMWLCPLQEENVVVRVLFAKVEMHERQHVHVRKVPVIKNIGRDKVEIIGVPLELIIEIWNDIAEMPQLMHKSRSRVEALELA